jgi:hypothetical protein
MSTLNPALLPVLIGIGMVVIAGADERQAVRVWAYWMGVALFLFGAGLHLAGCSKGAPSGTVPATATPWCFRATVEGETARACTETRKMCKRANASARRYGGMAKVSAVTDCEVEW